VVAAIPPYAPMDVAADGTSVFWAAQGNGTVAPDGTAGQAPTDGGAPVYIGPGLGTLGRIAVDSTSVYCTSWQRTAQSPLVRISKGGGSTTIARGGPIDVVVDGTYVYWIAAVTGSPGNVFRANKDGSGVVTLTATGPAVIGLAVDDAYVYWSDLGTGHGDGTIQKCAIAGCGGTPTTVASAQASPFRIAVDASAIYWLNVGNSGNGAGSLMKLAK
jgi:hypothetical protein